MSVEDVVWLDADTVRALHDRILEPGQLAGEADTRSVEAVLARVDNQVSYGEVGEDLLEIASAYGVAIARGHVFADGNKRTALAAMALFLRLNGYRVVLTGQPLAELMVRVASGEDDEDVLRDELLEHLRGL